MSHYFAMGGYAAYVWSAYGIFGLVFAGNALWAVMYGRAVRNRLKKEKVSTKERSSL